MKTEFYSPIYLQLLIGLIPLLLFSWWMLRLQRKHLHRFASREDNLSMLAPLRVRRKRIWRDLLLLIAIGLVLVALARPQVLGRGAQAEEQQGVEALICFDVSNSMLSQDIAPSRLSFARQAVSQLIGRSRGDKFGIVAFAADAFLQMPITQDLSAAQDFVSVLGPDVLSNQGTNIASAVELAVKSFSDRKDIGKAIIIITDGEAHDGDALEAVRNAQKAGIRVHVVGVGTTQGGVISTPEGVIKDEQGEVVMTKFSPEFCQELANAGGGSFISSSRSTQEVALLLEQELDHLPQANTGHVSRSNYEEKYQVWLWIALALLVLEFFISEHANLLLRRYNLFGGHE